MIFKSSNPQGALDKTRRKLGDVESNIASLKSKRAGLLAVADADNIGEVQAVNKHIEAEESAAAIYRDKIKALQEECRRLEFQCEKRPAPNKSRRLKNGSSAGKPWRRSCRLRLQGSATCTLN